MTSRFEEQVEEKFRRRGGSEDGGGGDEGFQPERPRWGRRARSSSSSAAAAAALGSSDEGAMKAATRWDQSWERRGCRGTMLLSAAEKKVRVQTERHDNFCPPALCFAP